MRQGNPVAGVLLLAILAGGCSALRDAFSGHSGEAARAAGQTLSVQRLADLAARVRGMPLEQRNLARLAGAYVDYALLAMAMAKGDSLTDSGLVAQAMWPVITQLKYSHYVERLRAGTRLAGAQVDSTYSAGELRAFQHILVSVAPKAAPPAVQQKQAQVNGIWRSLAVTGGANFAAVATRRSEDPGSKEMGGWLDVGPRGRFVPAFEEAAWQLQPGAMSGVVRSNFGFHVIRRPPLAEVRDSFAAGASRVLASRRDSAHFADLARERAVKVLDGAPTAIRNALEDVDAAGRSRQRLATYNGGSFEMRDFVRWLFTVDPRIPEALPTATDSTIIPFVRELVVRTIALQDTDKDVAQLTDSEWAQVRLDYDSMLARTRSLIGLTPDLLRDSATTADGRAQLAMSRVDQYFEHVVNREASFAPVAPLLTHVLRERARWSIDDAGVREAAQRAVALRAHADSLAPPGSGAGLRPAPGPAPLAPPDSVRP